MATKLAKNRTWSNRDVYEIPDHRDKVLKVANRPGNFSNWSEIVMYKSASEKKYFAQIISWSWSGKFLVMERLTPVTRDDLTGHAFPNWLNDKKSENFGRATSGEIKVLDYGLVDLVPERLIQF